MLKLAAANSVTGVYWFAPEEDAVEPNSGRRAAAQRSEHYEIVDYGTGAPYAERPGHGQAIGLLRQILEEEQFTDTKLTDLARSYSNQKAEQPGSPASPRLPRRLTFAKRPALSGPFQ